MGSRATARITAVVPMHDVEGFIGEFLASLDRQRPGDYELDVVFIDDASTDATVAIVEEWISRSALRSTLVRQPHGGVSAARNHGMSLAAGDWLTFPDPDDVLDADYFSSAAAALGDLDEDVNLGATNLQRVFDPDPAFHDVHALRFRFTAGNRVVSLIEEPDIFQMSVASGFFRVSALRATGAAFDRGLHASEDALFICRFLLAGPPPRIALIADARYGYRKRSTRDSAVDSYRDDPRSYIDRFRDGYLPVLQQSAVGGSVPEWLQSVVLYECQWLLPQQLHPDTYAAGLDEDERAHAREALGACLAYVSDDRLQRYDATALPLESRLIALALSGRPVWDWVGFYADPDRRLDRWSTVHGYGSDPDLRLLALASGHVRRIRTVKHLHPDYFGQTRLWRSVLRVPRRVDQIQDGDLMRPVVRPLSGESTAQAADRHLREVVGQTTALPSTTSAVRVWKYQHDGSWMSPARLGENVRVFAALRRHQLRIVGAAISEALPVPRSGWLLVRDPDDSGSFAAALNDQLTHVPSAGRVRLVDPVGGGRSHRRAASRSRFGVITTIEHGSALDHLGGWRVLVHRGPIDAVTRVAIDALPLDLVIVDTERAAERLRAESSYFDDQIVMIPRKKLVLQTVGTIQAWEEDQA
ncbi:glycosyltransferase family 2 protein [Microbacterium invictum]|uniref:glycosyltransferase family 2 protein n=1 Tax=Microbacterium invictum TaxID=515415 RepID=UPI0018872C7F|nr:MULTISPECIES: glycosyltransferase [Microbacterium]